MARLRERPSLNDQTRFDNTSEQVAAAIRLLSKQPDAELLMQVLGLTEPTN